MHRFVVFAALTGILMLCGTESGRTQQAEQCVLCGPAATGDLGEVAMLLDQGADVNAIRESGETPLWDAVATRHTDVALLLLEHKADPNARGTLAWQAHTRNETPLMHAIRNRDITLIKGLLAAGADVNGHDFFGDTALMNIAVSSAPESLEIVQLLLRAGADVNAEDQWGRTALGYATLLGLDRDAVLKGRVELFLAAGADPNRGNGNTGNPLAIEVNDGGGDLELCALLLAYGAKTDIRQPLLLDGIGANAGLGALLVNNGANVDLQNYRGKTALGLAIERNDLAQARVLVDLGAGLDALSGGREPLQIALEKGNPAMVELLLDHGANPIPLAVDDRIAPVGPLANPQLRRLVQDRLTPIARVDAILKKYDLDTAAAKHTISPADAARVTAIALAATHDDVILGEAAIADASARVQRPIPANAIAHEAVGHAAYTRATTRTDMLAAANEYALASHAAPWVLAYQRNACLLFNEAGAYDRSVFLCQGPSIALAPAERKTFNDLLAPYARAMEQLAAPEPGHTIRDGASSWAPEMVIVPPGSFTMGSPANEPHRFADEGPQHRVTIDHAFAVSRYPITFAEWDACVANGGCGGYVPADGGWGRGAQPVINVDFTDAQSYATWLTKKTGAHYALLSEAEYEYATRAGTTTAFPWGASLGKNHADCAGCGSVWDGKRPSPVGSFAPNAFGLYDMTGSVSEFVADCFYASYDGAPADGGPFQKSSPETCVPGATRGASYLSPGVITARSAARSTELYPYERLPFVGFRVARSLP